MKVANTSLRPMDYISKRLQQQNEESLNVVNQIKREFPVLIGKHYEDINKVWHRDDDFSRYCTFLSEHQFKPKTSVDVKWILSLVIVAFNITGC
jgi:hypothetical protein